MPVYLDDGEYGELQQHLMLNPETGELVRGSGGVRKLRWARPGMGKRGAAGHLLRQAGTRRVLDVDALLEIKEGQCTRARSQGFTRGVSR